MMAQLMTGLSGSASSGAIKKSAKPQLVRSTGIFCKVVLDHLREFYNSTSHWQCEGTGESDEVILAFVGCERAVDDTTCDLLADRRSVYAVSLALLDCFLELGSLCRL
jgi:hypothetical protein